MQRVRVGRVVTTSWPVSAVEGGVEGVGGTGGGLGGANASSGAGTVEMWVLEELSASVVVGLEARGYRPRHRCQRAHCSGDVAGKVKRP